MMAAAGTSAAVRTAWTPGTSRARLASIDTSRACAWGERSTTPCSMPGTRTSSTKCPAPVTSGSPPSRGCDCPIIGRVPPGRRSRRRAGRALLRRHLGLQLLGREAHDVFVLVGVELVGVGLVAVEREAAGQHVGLPPRVLGLARVDALHHLAREQLEAPADVRVGSAAGLG